LGARKLYNDEDGLCGIIRRLAMSLFQGQANSRFGYPGGGKLTFSSGGAKFNEQKELFFDET
jgi:hypothetical protein